MWLRDNDGYLLLTDDIVDYKYTQCNVMLHLLSLHVIQPGQIFKFAEHFNNPKRPTQDELTLFELETGVDEKHLKHIPKLLTLLEARG